MDIKAIGQIAWTAVKSTAKHHPYVFTGLGSAVALGAILRLPKNKQQQVAKLLRETQNHMILSSPELNPTGFSSHILPGVSVPSIDSPIATGLVALNNNLSEWIA